MSRPKIKERLLLKDMGYLRLPASVRDTYGSPKKYPEPDADVKVVGENIIVSYSFPLPKMPTPKGGDVDGERHE